jgi:hypothetical protein
MINKEEIQAAITALKEDDGEAALALLESMIASMAEGAADDEEPAGDEASDDSTGDDAGETEEEFSEETADEEEDRVVAKALMRLTGAPSATAAVEQYRKDQKRLEALDRDRSAYELRERRELIGELVKLGVETPALAWEGDASKRKPVKRLASEPLESLRVRVAAFRKSPRTQLRAPSSKLGEKDLSESERIALSKMNDQQKERYLSLRKMRRDRAGGQA